MEWLCMESGVIEAWSAPKKINDKFRCWLLLIYINWAKVEPTNSIAFVIASWYWGGRNHQKVVVNEKHILGPCCTFPLWDNWDSTNYRNTDWWTIVTRVIETTTFTLVFLASRTPFFCPNFKFNQIPSKLCATLRASFSHPCASAKYQFLIKLAEVWRKILNLTPHFYL